MNSRRRVNSTVMLLTRSVKYIACLIAFVLAFCVLPAPAQTTNRRKRTANKRTKVVTQDQAVNGGDLCGKPVTLVADVIAAASNTVTVQITVDESGNVIDAYAVSGDPKLQTQAVENAKQQKFAPKLLGGKPVKVAGVIVYRFEKP